MVDRARQSAHPFAPHAAWRPQPLQQHRACQTLRPRPVLAFCSRLGEREIQPCLCAAEQSTMPPASGAGCVQAPSCSSSGEALQHCRSGWHADGVSQCCGSGRGCARRSGACRPAVCCVLLLTQDSTSTPKDTKRQPMSQRERGPVLRLPKPWRERLEALERRALERCAALCNSATVISSMLHFEQYLIARA